MSYNSNTLTNLAQIAMSDLDTGAMYRNLQDYKASDAESDVMRDRLIEAAKMLSYMESDDRNLWERHDWRETCEAIAKRLNEGLACDRAWLRKLLK